MTQPIQLIAEIYAVEAPSIAFGFDINNYGDESELIYMLSMEDIADDPNSEETLIVKKLPPGDWQLICTTKECTEEQAKGIVEQEELFINGKSQGVLYCNYHCSHDVCEWYKAPLESLRSLLTSKGLDPEKNYVLIKKQ